MTFLKSLWKGDVSLWITFWVFGVAGNFAFSYLAERSQVAFIKGFPSAYLLLFYSLTAFWAGLTIFIWVAIWRAAGKYKGWRIWCYGARFSVVASLVLNIWLLYLATSVDTDDPGKDSSNIESMLHYDDRYPWVGFWKSNCSNTFGLAIDKAENGYYSVSFCGPSGCFKPGSYRPNTSLEDDDHYKLINNDTIEVEGRDGFSRYHRCGQ